MTASPEHVPIYQIFEAFPSQKYIKRIIRCLRIFLIYLIFQFFSGNTRCVGIYLIFEFFPFYDDYIYIRETEICNCEKLNGERCACFLKWITKEESLLVAKVLRLVQISPCEHVSPNHTPTSNIQKILSQLPQ